MNRPQHRVALWVQRHRTLARLVPQRLLSWLIWRAIARDSEFSAAIREGQADLAAGRWQPWPPPQRVSLADLPMDIHDHHAFAHRAMRMEADQLTTAEAVNARLGGKP